MNPNDQLTQALQRIAKLEGDLSSLNDAFFKNNFSARQDFTKSSSFTSRLKIPHYISLPATCEQGEVAESGGKLYIASATNTWTVAGTQS